MPGPRVENPKSGEERPRCAALCDVSIKSEFKRSRTRVEELKRQRLRMNVVRPELAKSSKDEDKNNRTIPLSIKGSL